jgi:uncharacterized damage-inducible protein DinB
VLWWRPRSRVRFDAVDGAPAGALVAHLPTFEAPMTRLAAILMLVLSTPALSQDTAKASSSPGVDALRAIWEQQSAYVLRSAEQMPESDYAFKPVATVRSFGQQIAHVAGSQYSMCASALGEPERAEDEIEKSTTAKAQLVAALRASTEYCRRAYAQSDADAMRAVTMYGEKRTRMWALALNATHDGEHYGNLITYMRIKGMVPPSSQRTP